MPASRRAGPSETITDEMWQADLDLKLFAQIRFCRLLFPQMKQRKWGRIISVLNIGAKAPGADSAPTSVSRAAQMAFTKALSQEGAPHNVLVNSLHVGVIVSDQIVRRHQREGANVSLEDFIAQAGRGVPMGRMGRAEEFANVACLPRLRRRLLCDRLRDQRRRRPLPGGVAEPLTRDPSPRRAGLMEKPLSCSAAEAGG